jgi:hypothetical protein
MRFNLGCELNYDVLQPTTLILNVEVQHLPTQEVVSERFLITGGGEGEVHSNPETGNRYRRLLLQPADYTVRYEAEIKLTPSLEPTGAIGQMAIADLPLDVMNHLFPSRYCQSDKLTRIAWRQFGDLVSLRQGYRYLQLDVRQRRLHSGYERHQHLGLRHLQLAGGRLPGFRASGHHVLPRARYPRKVCVRLWLSS